MGDKYRTIRFFMGSGRVVPGVIVKETRREYHVVTNMLNPKQITRLKKKDVEEKLPSKLSPMPEGLVDTLTKREILDLLGFLEAGGYKLPDHLKHKHGK